MEKHYLNEFTGLTEAWMDKKARIEKDVTRYLTGEVTMEEDAFRAWLEMNLDLIDSTKKAADDALASYLKTVREKTRGKYHESVESLSDADMEKSLLIKNLVDKIMRREISLSASKEVAENVINGRPRG